MPRAYKDIVYIEPEEYRPGTIAAIKALKRKRGNPKSRRKKCVYKDAIVTFDIETTRLHAGYSQIFAAPEIRHGIQIETGRAEQAIMYIWMLHIHHHTTIVGRTWKQLERLLDQMTQELDEDEKILIWVHNLSYEFQFLRAIHEWTTEEVFALDSRKVLKCDMGEHLEFRCSYLQSNMSLDQFTRKMGVKHQKLTGRYDYSKIRFPWTPIQDDEIPYCLYDVVGQAEAIEKQMELDDDNLYSIPLTSTGYVRRDAKKAMQQAAHSWIRDILPDVGIFKMLREEFAGGNTHASRFFSGRILSNVKSADRSSSYPDVQCNRPFPMSAFQRYPGCTFDDLIHLVTVRKRAVLARISISHLALRDHYWGCPYISRHKCRNLCGAVLDNGRVMSADYLEITVNDIDLQIIMDEYAGEICVIECAHARYGRLPQELRQVAIDYYRGKTELKGIEDMEVYYTKLKNKLNSIYGMSAQNPAKQSVLYIPGGIWELDDTPLEELLEDSNQRAFMTYAWGCWTTAWARYELECGIRLAGHNFVYCDTDSVKYIGDIDWTPYNTERIRASTKSGAWATDPAGNNHYMGVYEQEDTYAEFATLGAKKYAYNFPHEYKHRPAGSTFITIAGVTKSKGGAELDKGDKYGHGLPRFIDTAHPFTFYDAGGTEALYQDNPDPTPIQIDGHELSITPNIVIRDSTYTLGITAEYETLLYDSILPLDKWATEWYY